MTKLAASMEVKRGSEQQVPALVASVGLRVNQVNGVNYCWSSLGRSLLLGQGNGRFEKGILSSYKVGASSYHAVAIYVASDGTISFYDPNAGSYALNSKLSQTAGVQHFFTTYHRTCLPLKWPTHFVGDRISSFYSVTTGSIFKRR